MNDNHQPPPSSTWERIVALFLASIVLIAFIVYIFNPPETNDATSPIIRFLAACFAGLAAFLFVGELNLQGALPFNKLTIRAAGGFAAFILVFFLFYWGIKPVSLDSPPQEKYRRIYYENFRKEPVEDDKLSPLYLKGENSDWRGRFEPEIYRLCNKSNNPNASFTSRFSYITPDKGTADLKNSKVTLKVKVEEPNTKYSGAGILFRKTADKPDYYAFVLNVGNTVSLMRRSKNKLDILWSEEVSSFIKNGFLTLKIIGRGSKLDLFVNNQHIHTQENCTLLDGEPGIFAYSTGCFVFEDVAMFQKID